MPEMYRITCLIDNTAQFDSTFWGEHGLSFLIETDTTRFLFDTGQTPDVLAHNLAVLGKNLNDLAYVVLSHGHYDHTGGLPLVLTQAKRPTVIADPNVFARKYAQRNEHLKPIGIPLSRAQIETQAQLHLTEEPFAITEGITVTGRVPRTTDFETRDKGLLFEQDGNLFRDMVPDDRCLVLETERGLIVVLGCCHAGLINTLAHVRQTFGQPIYAVVGGTHLETASEEQIARTITAVCDEYEPQGLYVNHCTGAKAFAAFARALGEKVKPCPAGTTLVF